MDTIRVVSVLAELANEFRAENNGSLAGVQVSLELFLLDVCEMLELTPEQVSQVLAGDKERVLALAG